MDYQGLEWDRPLASFPFITVSEAWGPRLRARYDARGAQALTIEHGRTCEYVRELPDLRFVSIWQAMRDDTAVFDVPTLEHLVLFDRCRKPLGVDRLPRLLSLETDGRPGLTSARDHPALAKLRIHGMRETGLDWLGAPPALKMLSLIGRGQDLELTGLARAGTVEHLQVDNLRVADLTEVARLPALRVLHLELDGTPSGGPLDLAPLAGAAHLRELCLDGRLAVRSLAPLADLALDYLEVRAGVEVLDGSGQQVQPGPADSDAGSGTGEA